MNHDRQSGTDSAFNDSDGSYSGEAKEKAARGGKKTRMRLSFVCQSCRRRKIKCDKAQPKCGRCTKLHLDCVYDYKDQIHQKRLRDRSYVVQDHLLELENRFDGLWQRFNGPQQHECNTNVLETKNQSIYVNFFDGLRPNNIESAFKHDHKPFSDMSMIQRHSRLNPFLKYVTRSFKPMNQAVKRIIHSMGERIEPSSDETDSIAHILFLTPEIREILRRHRVNPSRISPDAIEAIRRCFLEKSTNREGRLFAEPIELHICASGEASNELAEQIMSSLPNEDQIRSLFQYFLRVVYPMVPYINKPDLEKTIAETLSFSPTGEVIALHLGEGDECSHKIGCMAILLVILRISYTALTVVDRPFGDEITSRVIHVAQKCISYLISTSHKTNEDIMSCLVLLRWSLLFSPREGEILAGSTTDSLMSAITNHAVKLGLYRDCIQINSENLNNDKTKQQIQYRAKLWMGTLILLRSDMCLRGNFPMLCDEYLNMVVKEKTLSSFESSVELEIHKILRMQLDLYSELSVFDKLSLTVHDAIDIDDIYPQLRKVEYKQQLRCPLPDKCVDVNDSSEEAIIQSMINAMRLKVNIMIRIYFLAIRAAIVVNLEKQIKEKGANLEYLLSRYKELYVECFEVTLDLTEILRTYMSSLEDNQKNYVLADHRYVLNKIVQIGIFRVSYYFVGIILTLIHVKRSLSRIMWEHKNQLTLVTEVDYKISIIDSISKKVFSHIRRFVELGSLTLADRYFASFKQFLFLDHSMQVIHNELNTDTPSELADILNLENLPVQIDYSPVDWEHLMSFISKSLDQDDIEPQLASADDILAETITQPIHPTESEPFNSVLHLDDEINIQSMLNGDYTWTDII